MLLANEKPSPLMTVEGQDSKLANESDHAENSQNINNYMANIFALADRGWPVFPANKHKRPLIADWPVTASTDLHRIREWWASCSDALVAVATGSASDLTVVDLDVKNGARGLESWETLTTRYGRTSETLTAKTRSGGLHLYFRFVAGSRCSASKLGAGIDIRSDGGCIIAPPSAGYRWLNPGAPAAEAPAWLRDLLVPQVPSRPVEHPRFHAPGDVADRARRYLRAMPPAISGQGGHGATYAAATALVHGFALDEETALDLLVNAYNPRCAPPWPTSDLAHKVTDAAQKPHARPRGWLIGGRP